MLLIIPFWLIHHYIYYVIKTFGIALKQHFNKRRNKNQVYDKRDSFEQFLS